VAWAYDGGVKALMSRNRFRPIVLLLAFAAIVGGPAVHAQTRRIGAKPIGPTYHGAAHLTLVDLNAASKGGLMTLPGISEPEAQKIIDGRPYTAKDQLLDKMILPATVYARVKEWVTTEPATR
jgi:competence protein ComEA